MTGAFYVYHCVNAVLALSFLACKLTPSVCDVVFSQPEPCELNDSECKLMFFAAFVIWAKTKKSGSRTMAPYIGTMYTYLKLVNLLLWFYAGPAKGIVYMACAIVAFLFFPEPLSSQVENVTYYSHEELSKALGTQRNTVFLVCFFATWLPSSVEFAKVFSRLSHIYALDNFVFGKVDVTRHPAAAEQYRISCYPLTRQLPTVIMFEQGREAQRRPGLDTKARLIPFMFTEENLVQAFDLNNLHKKMKDELPRFRRLEAKKQK